MASIRTVSIRIAIAAALAAAATVAAAQAGHHPATATNRGAVVTASMRPAGLQGCCEDE